MRFLVIGQGSMGKRRVRNLLALGYKDIIGFDPRADRRKESEEKYGIKTIDKLDDSLLKEREFFIVSTPPDHHLEYMQLAVKHKKPVFVEASVIKSGLEDLAAEAAKNNVLVAPSCTLRFHPAIRTIKELVDSGKYGKVCNWVYHMGQYLPDWHPWENIRDFYVSKKETSAGREMVPFELTWITDIVGMPTEAHAFYGRTHEMGVDIDDTYHVNFKFQKSTLGTLIVDVVARVAVRSLTLSMERGLIRWNWEDKFVKLYDANTQSWSVFHDPEGQAESGYNKNIIEQMYISELNTFIKAAHGGTTFPNTLRDDIAVLNILEVVEKTNKGVSL